MLNMYWILSINIMQICSCVLPNSKVYVMLKCLCTNNRVHLVLIRNGYVHLWKMCVKCVFKIIVKPVGLVESAILYSRLAPQPQLLASYRRHDTSRKVNSLCVVYYVYWMKVCDCKVPHEHRSSYRYFNTKASVIGQKFVL